MNEILLNHKYLYPITDEQTTIKINSFQMCADWKKVVVATTEGIKAYRIGKHLQFMAEYPLVKPSSKYKFSRDVSVAAAWVGTTNMMFYDKNEDEHNWFYSKSSGDVSRLEMFRSEIKDIIMTGNMIVLVFEDKFYVRRTL